jgi:acyl-CoA dehydrogenase
MNAPSLLDLDAFRREVRDFLDGAVPADIRAAVRARCLVTREQAGRWHRILHARGWAAPGWPREHGGPGWSLAQQAVFREALAASDAPRYENLGIDTIGPTLIRDGTPAQCARFLPRMLSFDDFWAQGYSEPEAGSDLASLRTTARRVGDRFVVNGSKIWQSYGHWANWALILVRSDPAAPRRQDGISVLLVDLTSPGVTVRPIRFMHGGVLHVQIFLDEVEVPGENLVGREHAGWAIAKGLLVTERLFVARVGECKAELEATRALLAERGAAIASSSERSSHARRLARLEIRTRALDAGWWPAVRAVEAGREPALESSLLKLLGNEVLQDLHQLQTDLLGPDALPFDPQALDGVPSAEPLSPGHANNLTLHVWRYRGITLGGGTSEVQRGIVARAIFSGETELERAPAEPDPHRTLPDDGLRRLLSERYGSERRRAILADGGSDASVWAALVEQGLPGLPVAERDGGLGGGPADVVAVHEALGEHLMLEPVLWSMLLPAQLLSDSSGWPGRADALAALLAGERFAFAGGDAGGPTLLARRDGGGWRLSGHARLVPGADGAERILALARLEGGGDALFAVAAHAPGLAARRYRLHDGRGAADLRLDAVRVAADDRLAGPERAAAIVEAAQALATIALCAETAGAMRRALALTVEHLRTRRQFGRALADHQALQHRVVEHFRGWVATRALVGEAAAGLTDAGSAERRRRIAAAKWMAGRAGRALALDALQLHGAIGLQDETAISHYARRLTADDALLGSGSSHLERFVALGEPQREGEAR